jgi:hypothetical protein
VSTYHEQIIIKEILKKNGYKQSITNQKHINKSLTNLSQATQRTQKEKLFTFTYFGHETRTITNLFLNINLKIVYKTTNTIKHHLKPRGKPRDIYNQSGDQLQCSECPLEYVVQTGRTFKVRYREHINALSTNRQNSTFAQHILEAGHDYNTLDQFMKILHIEKKGPKLDILEGFHIYDITKKGLQMNDIFTDV